MIRSFAERKIFRRVEDALIAVFPRSVRIYGRSNNSGYNIKINGQPVHVRWIGECGLRQVRELLVKLHHMPDIVVARRTSPGARAELSKAGIGWVDETGAADIVLSQIIISKSGRPDDRRKKAPKWTSAVFAVAEALLCGTKATVSATVDATNLSQATCTNSLRSLTELKLLTATAKRGRESARSVGSISQLLDTYSTAVTAVKPPVSLTVGVTWRDFVSELTNIGKQWEKAGKAWAATGSVAASVMAPYLTSITSGEVYVDAKTIAGLEAIALDVGLKPIEGGRLTLMPFPTVTTKLLLKKQQGLNIAPWPRVYADLHKLGVRGEEAAEHLREVLNGK